MDDDRNQISEEELQGYEKAMLEKTLKLFRELTQTGDERTRWLAKIAAETIERDGLGFCYSTGGAIAGELLKRQKEFPDLGTVHMWYAKGHGIPVAKVKDRADFIDAFGHTINYKLQPGITTLKPTDTHHVFGNPKVSQFISKPFDVNDKLLQGVAFSTHTEIPVKSLADIFTKV